VESRRRRLEVGAEEGGGASRGLRDVWAGRKRTWPTDTTSFEINKHILKRKNERRWTSGGIGVGLER